jgi:transcriptional regulator with XRE-family HTH domain
MYAKRLNEGEFQMWEDYFKTATRGTRLRAIRNVQGLSISELARASGVSTTTIARAEHDGEISIGLMLKIAKVLGVTLDDLTLNAKTPK